MRPLSLLDSPFCSLSGFGLVLILTQGLTLHFRMSWNLWCSTEWPLTLQWFSFFERTSAEIVSGSHHPPAKSVAILKTALMGWKQRIRSVSSTGKVAVEKWKKIRV